MSHELYPYGHPERKPLTSKQKRMIRKILETPPEDPKDVKVRELRSQRRKARWQERQNMIPNEVLSASDASQGEIDFLLGKSNFDPHPRHRIVYQDLEPGDEVIVFKEFFGKDKKKKIKTRTPRPGTSDSKIDRVLFSIGIYESASEKRRLDIEASLDKQARFKSMISSAVPIAGRSSDAIWFEFDFLDGMKDSFGEKYKDPNPNHVITYRKLVPKKQINVSKQA